MSEHPCPWKVRRQLVEKPNSLSRWDRAYQCLLQINYKAEQLKLTQAVEAVQPCNIKPQEATNENRSVCQSFDPSSN